MAVEKKFSNALPDEKKERKIVTKLTVLKENDKNTIYNLLFVESAPKKLKGTDS